MTNTPSEPSLTAQAKVLAKVKPDKSDRAELQPQLSTAPVANLDANQAPRTQVPKAISARVPRMEHRRHQRYLVKWRIAIVYEGGAGKKIFHGRVNEISLGGLSIHCDHNVFYDGKVILLLALPPLFAGAREKILEITCRMNYTILSKKLFRIGLEFVEFRSGERKLLEERLEISNAGGIGYTDG